jgi:hypothetical protein
MTNADRFPIEMYKAFIETCVEVAGRELLAERIRQNGHAERTNEGDLALDEKETIRKQVLLQLDPAQRETIAHLLEECRRNAIHDLLARLEWMMSADDFRMIWKGVEIPRSPYWSLHHDFMGRHMSFPWPQSDEG